MATCILVVGVPRSGTSAIAHVLRHLGIDMGSEFFQSTSMCPAGGSCQDLAFQEVEIARISLEEYLAVRQASGKDWGLKSHNLYKFLPGFAQLCDRLRIIRTSRPIDQSRKSWVEGMRRQWSEFNPHNSVREMPPVAESDVDLIAAGIEEAIRSMRPLPTLTVDFDSLLSRPAWEVGRIAGFVGRPVAEPALAHVDAKLRTCF